MANYATLKAAIADAIKQNGNNEITGTLLQQQLLAMVNSLGVGYQYMGVATPDTNPGTPDQNVFYLASEPGIYANFSNRVIAENEIAILKYNGTWTKETTGAASANAISQITNSVFGLQNEPNLRIRKGWLDSSGKCVYFATSTHAVIPVNPGDVVNVLQSANGQSIIAFLSDYEPITQDGQEYDIIGSRYVVTSQTQYTVPETAKYVWVGLIGNGTDLSPRIFEINGYDYKKSIIENVMPLVPAFGTVQTIYTELYGFTGQISLSQGYATADVENRKIVVDTLATRVKTIIINGNYNIKTKPGFVIRGIAAWNGGQSSGTLEQIITVDDCDNIVSGMALTEYTKKDNWNYSVITFCKTDASANILPSEDIIAEFTPLGLVERVNILEQDQTNPVIKKAVFMGDSITHGVYSYWHDNIHEETDRYNGFDITNINSVEQATAYHGIHYYFGIISKCRNVVNLGKRGTGYVADTRNIGNALVVANNYDYSDVDFVALCFGVNDYIQGKEIGDILTRESGTIIGNMCATIEKILTDNPLCKIVVYSPYNTWGQVSYGGDYTSNVHYGDEASNYALGHTINGNTLQDIINAEDDVCIYYGIQHVKLSRSNVINRFTIKNILIDGLHPSKESYIKLAAEIYGKGNFGD